MPEIDLLDRYPKCPIEARSQSITEKDRAGASQTIEMAVRLARPKGGKIVIAGILATGAKISVNPFDFIQGQWLGGGWGGWINPDQDIPKMVDLCRQGSVRYELLKGQIYPLERVNEALAALTGEDPGRPILQFCGN